MARKAGAELVILDNLATLAEIEDENSAAAFSPVLGFLLRLKQADMACILVHHSGKGGESFRGSSKLATTFEVSMGLTKLDGRSITEDARFELRFDKFRGAPSGATRNREVVLKGVAGDGLEWASSPAPSEDVAVLLDAVRSGTFETQREIATHLAWDPAKVARVKVRAIEKGETTAAAWKACLEIAKGEMDF